MGPRRGLRTRFVLAQVPKALPYALPLLSKTQPALTSAFLF